MLTEQDVFKSREKWGPSERGKAARAIRQQLKLGLRAVGAGTGIDIMSISNFETARHGISAAKEAKLINFLTMELARQQAQLEPDTTRAVYGTVMLSSLAKPSEIQPVHPLYREAVLLAMDFGKAETGGPIGQEQALDFAERFTEMSDRLSVVAGRDLSMIKMARSFLEQSQELLAYCHYIARQRDAKAGSR